MSIKKPAPRQPTGAAAALEKFVSEAPGAASAPTAETARYTRVGAPRKNPKKAPGELVQIAVKFSQGDIDLIDAAAASQRVSRAAYIRQAVFGFMDGKQ
jgi:hypothetical protein